MTCPSRLAQIHQMDAHRTAVSFHQHQQLQRNIQELQDAVAVRPSSPSLSLSSPLNRSLPPSLALTPVSLSPSLSPGRRGEELLRPLLNF